MSLAASLGCLAKVETMQLSDWSCTCLADLFLMRLGSGRGASCSLAALLGLMTSASRELTWAGPDALLSAVLFLHPWFPCPLYNSINGGGCVPRPASTARDPWSMGGCGGSHVAGASRRSCHRPLLPPSSSLMVLLTLGCVPRRPALGLRLQYSMGDRPSGPDGGGGTWDLVEWLGRICAHFGYNDFCTQSGCKRDGGERSPRQEV